MLSLEYLQCRMADLSSGIDHFSIATRWQAFYMGILGSMLKESQVLTSGPNEHYIFVIGSLYMLESLS